MTSVFLSHSKADHKIVARLADDLEAAGIKVWLDERSIDGGDELLDSLEEGLSKSDFVCVWLTNASSRSGWVKKEWKLRVMDETATGQVMVLPLLGEECAIPYWLKDRRYTDFREDYDAGLKKLLATIRKKGRNSFEPTSFIYEKTLAFLEDLSGAAIEIPFHAPIKIIETLRRMPRSGKLYRLNDYEPKIRVRSVYEHILSISHTADGLFSVADHAIPRGAASDLARLIAYHELNEVILGDIPAFTSLRPSGRSLANVNSEPFLKRVDTNVRESVTNAFIAMFLEDMQKTSLEEVNSLRDKGVPLYRFFHVLDKIDPIIAVWRYLFLYRGTLEKDARIFLSRMKDFFSNPQVKSNVEKNTNDVRIMRMAEALQDERLAMDYYRDENFWSREDLNFGFDAQIIAHIIEKAPKVDSGPPVSDPSLRIAKGRTRTSKQRS